MQVLFQFHQLLAFTFLQSRDGNVRPARYNFGDIFLGYFFAKQRLLALRAFRGRVSYLLFQLWYPAVLNFTRPGQLTTTLCPLELSAELVKFFFPFPLF